ncbi:MAG: hypothetical protein HYR51_03420 [Candidatus Rokubacteria bacterium]|nr:hypothetical protein [Candidatus Rokubacteria bacterium]
MIALAMLVLLAVIPGTAGAHLFHTVYEVPDNQLTRDYLVLVKLVDYPYEKFDVAARTYRGEERVRLKPGGFRGWLRRPAEPGLVFKAEYQLARWSGTLAGECRRLDAAHGTRFASRIETALAARQAEPVKAAFREAFVFLIAEIFDALERHLDEPEAASTLYQFLGRYHAVAHEAWLNVHDRSRAVVVRSALDAVERALGDRARGVPPAPEAFAQQRTRVLRTLREAFGIA